MTPIGFKRANKWNARKVKLDGYTFDSQKEAERYRDLRLLEKAGEIFGIEVHPKFPIEIQGKLICFVELDFLYSSRGRKMFEDIKGRSYNRRLLRWTGTDTPLSRLKRKLVEACYQIKVDVV